MSAVTASMKCAYMLIGLTLGLIIDAQAQMEQVYTLDHSRVMASQPLTLSLHATTGGTYYMSATSNPRPLSVYRDSDNPTFSPQFHNMAPQNVGISFAEPNYVANLSQQLSARLLSSATPSYEDDILKLYLAQDQPFRLNMNYTLGVAQMDLSGLALEQLKVSTGNARVRVGYRPGFQNVQPMDSLLMKADFGTLYADNINQSLARHIVAEVGMGTLHLNFSDQLAQSANVSACVGAGRLNVMLPHDAVPVLVTINKSPLRTVHLPEHFVRLENGVYANQAYINAAQDQEHLAFSLNVAMGSIHFTSAADAPESSTQFP